MSARGASLFESPSEKLQRQLESKDAEIARLGVALGEAGIAIRDGYREIKRLRAEIKRLLRDAVPASAEDGDKGMCYVEMTHSAWRKVVAAAKKARAALKGDA